MDEERFRVNDKVRRRELDHATVIEIWDQSGVLALRWPNGSVTLADSHDYEKVPEA